MEATEFLQNIDKTWRAKKKITFELSQLTKKSES
jgi:hypothetical protein